jgi:hypothetical protein
VFDPALTFIFVPWTAPLALAAEDFLPLFLVIFSPASSLE